MSRRITTAVVTFALMAGGVPAAIPAAAAPPRCDPRAYGVQGDGVHDDTIALQATIDACAAHGGGTVELRGPQRTYVTGPLQLKSHITLKIDEGATLRATDDTTRFTWAFIGYGFSQSDPSKPEALLWGKDVTDVAISGGGTVDGRGAQNYWPAAVAAKKDLTAHKSAATYADLARQIEESGVPSQLPASTYSTLGAIPTSNGLPRPWLVEFYNARHVRVDGVTFTNAPMWNLGLRYCTDVAVTDYRVSAPADSPNTDGIDVVSSSRVRLQRLDIATGDDNIAIKSGFPGFPTPAVATKGVTIQDARFGTGHGLSIGSEASNGVQDVRASRLTFTGTDNGFRIKSGRDRGADISGIQVRDVTMTGVAVPIFLTDYYTGQPKAGVDAGLPVTPTTPHIHDVSIERLAATGATRSQMVGLPEAPLRNIALRDVRLEGATGLQLRNVTGSFNRVASDAASGPGFVVEEGVAISGLPR